MIRCLIVERWWEVRTVVEQVRLEALRQQSLIIVSSDRFFCSNLSLSSSLFRFSTSLFDNIYPSSTRDNLIERGKCERFIHYNLTLIDSLSVLDSFFIVVICCRMSKRGKIQFETFFVVVYFLLKPLFRALKIVFFPLHFSSDKIKSFCYFFFRNVFFCGSSTFHMFLLKMRFFSGIRCFN